MEHKDGGPAFPVHDQGTHGTYGMSLRDAFAIAALQSGEASNWRDNDYTPTDGLSIIENSAICAYQFADAMIKARDRAPDSRCEYCDGTGDVHGLDGEWRGSCNCGQQGEPV